MGREKILVWLPSPLGDAVMCTPALRAIRAKFTHADISFLASATVREILSPCDFADRWITLEGGFVSQVLRLRREKFDHVILFKNSFASAMTVFAAGISKRLGYTRDGRGVFLTDKIRPSKVKSGGFAPRPMIDYYLKLCESIGCDIAARGMELSVDQKDLDGIEKTLPSLFESIISRR